MEPPETDAAPTHGPGGPYIEGVSDYCDRWCERCPLAGRCRLRAFELELGDLADPADTDADRRARFWRALKTVYGVDARGELHESDAATVDELWEGEGPAATSIYEAAEADDWDGAAEWDEGEEPADPLSFAARDLAVDLLKWLREHGEAAQIACDAAAVHPSGVAPSDALDVIRWYGVQLGPKLHRAARADARGRARDRAGSAKVALIAAERAFGGWTVLRDVLPAAFPARREAFAAEIADFQRRLASLRAAIDRTFPAARTFIRPGFDDGTLEEEIADS
ncbi:hypothetical protein [Alienimonas chondri]|uniref:Uncharacterized protein n=1 Tax=Alienimonas chondri TaxID=2681879 RepID=A0ABX1VJ11_9PLAN|nr:hypothetical protein [Alienimonas chondri]NNJ27441.1 hypothetical protein [Alienimonas chondri]